MYILDSIPLLWFSYLFFSCYPIALLKSLYNNNSFILFLISPLTWIITLYMALSLGYSLYYHTVLQNYSIYKYHKL